MQLPHRDDLVRPGPVSARPSRPVPRPRARAPSSRGGDTSTGTGSSRLIVLTGRPPVVSSGERIRAARCGGQPASTSWSSACRSTADGPGSGPGRGNPASSSRLARQPTTSTGAPAPTPEGTGRGCSHRLCGHALFAASGPPVLTGEGTRRKNAVMRWHQHSVSVPLRAQRRPAARRSPPLRHRRTIDDETQRTLRRARPEPLAGQPHPAVPARRHDGGSRRPRRAGGDRQPHDRRQGHRVLRRLRPAVPRSRSRPDAPSRTPTGTSSSPTSSTRWSCLRPTFDASDGADGFVSIEVAPELAHDTEATIEGRPRPARAHRRAQPAGQDPRDHAGVPAIEAMVAEGRSINVTLIFSLARYRQVIEAYLVGPGDPGPTAAGTSRRSTAWPRSSSAGSTPRSTGAWRRSAPTRRSRCAAEPRSPRPSSPTSSSARPTPVSGGNGWPTAAPGCSGRCGHPRRPRTPPTPTPCTSTA